MPFKLTVDGTDFLTDDLTLGECEVVEELTGAGWGALNPLGSAKQCRVLVQVFLTRTISAKEAEEKARGLTVRQLMRNVDWVEEDLPAVYENGIPDPKVVAVPPIN